MTEIINKKYLTQAASTVFEQPTDPVVGLHKENPTSKVRTNSVHLSQERDGCSLVR